MFVHNYKLNEQGLKRFFGPLEAQIMEIVWGSTPITIKEVQQKLAEELNFNTVMTVLNRLVEKGHLEKQYKGRSTQYLPVQSKEEFLHAQTKAMTKELMGEYADLVVVHMLDDLDQVDPKLIHQLEERLNQLKNKKQG